jgi:hypothetical protein
VVALVPVTRTDLVSEEAQRRHRHSALGVPIISQVDPHSSFHRKPSLYSYLMTSSFCA